MLTDLQRDILIKSAEGIQEGMWCKGLWFAKEVDSSLDAVDKCTGDANHDQCYSPGEFMFSDETGELAINEVELLGLASRYRCVEGELALQTAFLGGRFDDYLTVERAVGERVFAICGHCSQKPPDRRARYSVYEHNDNCMGTKDAFTAGQEWAEIFRSIL